MSKIISVHSYRGGTGKSNMTANLASIIARGGNRVAIVDTDIQSGASRLCKYRNNNSPDSFQ
ncbi:P-loop NTPase [Microcoleus sp. CAWBG27]|uniref:nucleotide-binding protein n=1 Tax=Microcoleus sp. CAWBG27 TaxID=2841645 RepID=UPI0025D3F05F|nr:P-loop NTPase [Microcoleus sp. CAWBG27]